MAEKFPTILCYEVASILLHFIFSIRCFRVAVIISLVFIVIHK